MSEFKFDTEKLNKIALQEFFGDAADTSDPLQMFFLCGYLDWVANNRQIEAEDNI